MVARLLLPEDRRQSLGAISPDHTREEVPLLVRYQGGTGCLGCRATFADVAASLGAFFRLPEPWPIGASFV